MKLALIFAVICVSCSAVIAAAPARADGVNADCNVRENGDNKKKKSGPCTVTESNGHIWILLANGDSFTLKPREKKDRFRDQDGKDVSRTIEAGLPVYSWGHRHITVNMRSKK